MFFNVFFGKIFAVFCNQPCGARDFASAAVVKRDIQYTLIAGRAVALDGIQDFNYVVRKILAVAQNTQFYPSLDERSEHLCKILSYKVNKSVYLVLGAKLVFGGKRVKRDELDSRGKRMLCDFIQSFHACAMPERPYESALFRPPAVAVHYYGNVLRHRIVKYRNFRLQEFRFPFLLQARQRKRCSYREFSALPFRKKQSRRR